MQYQSWVKSLKRQIMVEESNRNVFFIQIDASSFAEYEISEFEISRFDRICIWNYGCDLRSKDYSTGFK